MLHGCQHNRHYFDCYREHGRAGCPDQGSQKSSYEKKYEIDFRRSPQRSTQVDTAGNREQPPQQDNEGDVVNQVDVQDFLNGLTGVPEKEWDGEQQGPEGRDLGEMSVPEMWRDQGAQGDGKKDAQEWDDRPKGQKADWAGVGAATVIKVGFAVSVTVILSKNGRCHDTEKAHRQQYQ